MDKNTIGSHKRKKIRKKFTDYQRIFKDESCRGLKDVTHFKKNRAKIHQNHQIPPESPNHSSLIAPQTTHFTTTSLYCNICLSLEQKKETKKDSISINTHIIPFISGCFSPYFVLHLDTASTCLLCLMFQST